MLAGGRLWPAIWVGSFAANLTVEGAIFVSALIATGSTLQALALATLVRRHIGVPRRFETIEHVIKLVLLAAAGSTIAPTLALIPLANLLNAHLERLSRFRTIRLHLDVKPAAQPCVGFVPSSGRRDDHVRWLRCAARTRGLDGLVAQMNRAGR